MAPTKPTTENLARRTVRVGLYGNGDTMKNAAQLSAYFAKLVALMLLTLLALAIFAYVGEKIL
jgi:hypothetical protein